MHDAGADFAADAGQVIQVLEQRVDHGAVRISGGGVHHHARGLVNHGQIIVLIEYIQRDVLRLHARRRGVGQLRGHFVAFLERKTGL